MRPLFSDAPIQQPSPVMPAQPVGSALAAALSRPGAPLSLPSANFGSGIPLASMMNAAASNPGTGSNVTSATPNLAWNPNNAVGTDTLNGGTANQGGVLNNWWQSLLQQPPPSPGMPTSGAPGTFLPTPSV